MKICCHQKYLIRAKTQQLLQYERWVVVLAFVLAAIMNPTPNVLDLAFIAGPIVLMYQLSIAIIWWQRRGRRASKAERLRAADLQIQAERRRRAAARAAFSPAVSVASASASVVSAPVPQPSVPVQAPRRAAVRTREPVVRPRQYINDFLPSRRPDAA